MIRRMSGEIREIALDARVLTTYYYYFHEIRAHYIGRRSNALICGSHLIYDVTDTSFKLKRKKNSKPFGAMISFIPRDARGISGPPRKGLEPGQIWRQDVISQQEQAASSHIGTGIPWSKIEDQALVVLVHDVGTNWEIFSDIINSSLQLKGIFRKPID